MTEILHKRPPNFEEVCKVFPAARRQGTIFSYAPYIYIPSGHPLAPQLVAHEEVHIERQKIVGVELWWKRYLEDASFRYNEELLAHRVEYHWLIENAPSRGMRRAALKIVAKRLASVLYGNIVSPKKAMEDILNVA